MIQGIINIYKEKGVTSFDVVARLRGILRQKKIGHTGTLDPDAEGVLPVCLGRATKVCGLLTDKDKVYETVLLLGRTTDTQDISGQVIEEKDTEKLDPGKVRTVIGSFVGEYLQVPPMYSARKVQGKRLYQLAREGITVEREARPVNIRSIDIVNLNLPEVYMRIHCSKGTYIRTLCHDIGQKLGCGGCMESLIRTRVADFGIEDALHLEQVEELVREENINSKIISVDKLFLQYPPVRLSDSPEADKLLANGNRIPEEMVEKEENTQEDMVRLYDHGGHFCGLYVHKLRERDYKPVKLFMETS